MELADIVFESYVDALKVKRPWFSKRAPVKLDFSRWNIKEQEIDPYIREVINATWYLLVDLRKGRFVVAKEWVKDKYRIYKKRGR